MHSDTSHYNKSLRATEKAICTLLAQEIGLGLPEAQSKIWHAHPVWFLDDNPVVHHSRALARLSSSSGSDYRSQGYRTCSTLKDLQECFHDSHLEPYPGIGLCAHIHCTNLPRGKFRGHGTRSSHFLQGLTVQRQFTLPLEPQITSSSTSAPIPLFAIRKCPMASRESPPNRFALSS